MSKALFIERETYQSKDGNERFTYFVKGKIRGVEVKASVMPADIGGFELLDIVFGDENKAQLVVEPFTMKDEASGREINGLKYEALNVDKDGTEYRCKVKPRQPSDKDKLLMLLR